MLVHDAALKKAILEAMADDCSLVILGGTKDRAHSAMEIVHQCTFSPSSVYRRISQLVAGGLLTIDKIVVTDEGKKYSLYRSAIREVSINYKAGEVEVSMSINEDVVGKVTRLWAAMRQEA